MKATTVRLDEGMLGRVDHLAGELSRSISWVIKQAIERFDHSTIRWTSCQDITRASERSWETSPP